jgi:hypothetical protein
MAESQEPQGPEAQVSEAQIAVHWREEEYYPPPPKFVEQANAKDPAIFERFTEDKFPDCFKEYADLLTWDQPCTQRWTPAIRCSYFSSRPCSRSSGI